MVPPKLHVSLKHRFPCSLFSTIPPSLSLLADQCTTIHHIKQVRAQASSPNPHHSLCLHISMRKLGAIPGKHTFPFLLKACSNIPSLPACTQVHTHVLKFGMCFDSHVANGVTLSPVILPVHAICSMKCRPGV
ncbi:hypothetical protein S83_056038 [Arachis hypogaea]